MKKCSATISLARKRVLFYVKNKIKKILIIFKILLVLFIIMVIVFRFNHELSLFEYFKLMTTAFEKYADIISYLLTYIIENL